MRFCSFFLFFVVLLSERIHSSCLLPVPGGEIIVGSGEGVEEGILFEWDFCQEIGSCHSHICRSHSISCGGFPIIDDTTTNYINVNFSEGSGVCDGAEVKTEVRFYCADLKPPQIKVREQCDYLIKLFSQDYCPSFTIRETVTQQRLANLKRRVEDHSLVLSESNICDSKHFKNLGDLVMNIRETTFLINLCDGVQDCDGKAIGCQLLSDGRAKSLGKGPLVALGGNQFQISDGTVGCFGKARSATIEFPPHCHSDNPTIIGVDEIDCEYKVTIGRADCRPIKSDLVGKLKRKLPELSKEDEFKQCGLIKKSGHAKCVLGDTFNCNFYSIHLRGGCSGKFWCQGNIVVCSYHTERCPCY